MKQILDSGVKPDAVFCHNDPTAMGAMQAIFDAGLRIPQDVAVAGCGNVRYAKCLRVPLTSVDQNCRGMGEAAGRLALSLAEKPGRRPIRFSWSRGWSCGSRLCGRVEPAGASRERFADDVRPPRITAGKLGPMIAPIVGPKLPLPLLVYAYGANEGRSGSRTALP